jgi:hypothetical protein
VARKVVPPPCKAPEWDEPGNDKIAYYYSEVNEPDTPNARSQNCDNISEVRTSTLSQHFSMWCIRTCGSLFVVVLLPLEQVLEAEGYITLKVLQ